MIPNYQAESVYIEAGVKTAVADYLRFADNGDFHERPLKIFRTAVEAAVTTWLNQHLSEIIAAVALATFAAIEPEATQ